MDNYRKILGQQLREIRQGQGMTVRALADKAGLNHPTIVNLEAGKFSPTVDTLHKIVTALGKEIVIE